MKTKGALIWEFNQPWSIEEIEIGDPQKDELKIQMETVGMCHSDHHLDLDFILLRVAEG